MTEKTELLPCPFCGSDALHYDNGYATCPKYRCSMNGLVVKNENWNTRAAPAEDVLQERAWDYSTYNYHELFNAIAEAVRPGPNSSISISVEAFEKAMIKLNS